MINSQPYLIFSLNGSHYGVDAIAVGEIFPLPELTPLVEAPRDVVGVVNLRGELLPVIDLGQRWGYTSLDYQLSDTIIVLVSEGRRLGIVVNQVYEVETVKVSPTYERDLDSLKQQHRLRSTFIKGTAQIDADIVMLLDYQKLLTYSETVEDLVETEDLTPSEEIRPPRLFCPNATPEEREIFQQRAQNLMQSTDGEDLRGFIPMAVISLGGEYFGLDLQLVREFTDILNLTPVPCCPAHIVGNMNLRGEILTLVDIRSVINLPLNTNPEEAKAMIIQMEDLVTGITVDEVFDVTYVNPTEINAVPVAVHSVDEEYLQGTTQYQDHVLSVLDLPKIMTNGNLVVDETI